MYAVIGITGQVGGAVAKALLREGKQVRGIVRDESKAEAFKALGAEIAVASIEDASALEHALVDVDGVFAMTPPLLESLRPRTENEMALAAISHAVQANHVAKIVFLSSVGAQHDAGTGAILKLHDMETMLFALSIPAVSVRAAWFMENYLALLPIARDSGKLPTMLEPLERAIPMVATADIGELAASLLTETWAGNRIVEFEGPRAYSPLDVASAFSKTLGRPVAAEVVPEGARLEMYKGFGLSPEGAANMVEMADAFNKGLIQFEGGDAEHRTGQTTLETVLAG